MNDFKYSEDYDLLIDRDFVLASQYESDKQLIQLKLIGDNTDFVLQKELCATLSDYIGENNDETTATAVNNRVYSVLAADSMLDISSINVSTVPVDYDTINVSVSYTANDDGYVKQIYEYRELVL